MKIRAEKILRLKNTGDSYHPYLGSSRVKSRPPDNKVLLTGKAA